MADIWIAIGVALLLIDGSRKPRKVMVDPSAVLPVSARVKPQ